MKKHIKHMVFSGLVNSRLDRVIARRYRGPGVILMIHEMREDPKASFSIGTSPETLNFALEAVKADGRDIVDLDEALRRLKTPGSGKFAVVTFDDGYRDNQTIALPILEKHRAPATIYVPTEMVDRSINAWWLALRELFLTRDQLDIAPMSKGYILDSYAGRQQGFEEVVRWIWDDFTRADLMPSVFDQARLDVADLVDRYALNTSELKRFSDHPLITIGGHTTTHRALATLSASEKQQELRDNKAFLEDVIGQDVAHFAYPYGRPAIDGEPEAKAARAAGFRSAVTTDPGHLFPVHADDPFLLPRENCESDGSAKDRIRMGLSGLFYAMKSGFGPSIANEPNQSA